MKDKVIIFFTRIPTLGKTKTRLQPFLNKSQAVELQTAFIKDIYSNLNELGIDIIISYSEDGDLQVLKEIIPDDIPFVQQRGRDLGEKMHHALSSSLREYKKAVLIGSDLPLITGEDLETAFAILEKKEIAISPTYDGGFYLIGMKAECKELFEIKYSTERVFSETIERIKAMGKSFGLGQIQLDIDNQGDFLKLWEMLKEDNCLPCDNTRAVVNEIMEIKLNQKISIIIPVYNEAATIKELLVNLEQFRDDCELIFVDGGSSDGTAMLIKEQYGLVSAPKKGRANQMNYGASLANGEIFLFLHADSILPAAALMQIKQVMGRGHRVGCFKLEFDSSSLLMKICGFMSNFRVIFRNIAFGDQGIFITKDYFEELGGFPELPLMEDYQLSLNIKGDGEKIALAKGKIKTSERRFTEQGRLRTMIRMQRLQYMYRRGKDIQLISALYK